MENKNDKRNLVTQLSKLNKELRKLELEVIEIEKKLAEKKDHLDLSR
jgi:hypothetical protein